MLDDRRLFVTLAEAGSLARTARLLGVSRSTVMRRLDGLEAELGIALVHRAGRRIALTDAGHRYADALKPVLASLDRVEQELHEASGRLVGTLRLALPFLGVSRFLTPAFAAFLRAHPGVVLDVQLARDVRHLEVGTFDVAMQYGTRSNPDLHAQVLYRERLVLCASASYVQAYGVPEEVDVLDAHRVVMQRDLEGRVVPWRHPDGRRVDVPTPVALTNSVVVAYELMLEGLGIARVPQLLAQEALDDGRAVAVLPEVVSEAPVLFVFAPDPDPVTRAFLKFMEQASQGSHPLR